MANLNVLDATETSKYLKTSGAGTDLDPHVPAHSVEGTVTTTVAGGTVTVDSVTVSGGTVAVTNDALTELAGAIDTELQVDVVTSALPSGAATAAGQATNAALLTTIDADTSTLAGAVSGSEMQVDIVSGAVTVSGEVTVASGTVTVDSVAVSGGTIAATQSGDWNVGGTVEATVANATIASGTVDAVQSGDWNVGGTVVATVADATIASGSVTATQSGDWNVGGTVDATVADATIASGTVDVSSIAAGENVIGLVGASDIVVTITPTTAAEAHSVNDILFDSTEIADAVRSNGNTAIVQSVTIVDKGKQSQELDLIFSATDEEFGTPGSPTAFNDTVAASIIGVVNVPESSYTPFPVTSVATLTNVGLLLQAGTAATSFYLAAETRGTPTPASTSDYQIAIGLLRS